MTECLPGPCKRRRDKAADDGSEESADVDSCLHTSLACPSPAPMSEDAHGDLAATCTEENAGNGCDDAIAADDDLVPVPPTLLEVLTRLLITDRNIRDSWR